MRHSRISEEAAEPPSEPAVASGAASEAGSGPPSPPLRSATDSELPPSARTVERQSSEEQPATPGRAERRCSFHAMGQTVLGSIRMRRALAERIDIHMPFGTLQMTELLAACANGEAERVANIIQLTRSTHGEEGLKVELESTDDWAGSAALHWAAYSGKVEVVRLVVAAGAKHDATNSRDASTPLHLAARYGKAPVVKELAEAAPHMVAVKNDMGNTPLHEAAYQGMWEATEELLRAGASTEVRNNEAKGGITPLLAAVAFGRLLTVRSLLKGGADPTAMPRAAEALFRRPVDSGKNGVRKHSLPREMPPAMMKARSLGRLPSSSKGLAADKEAAKPSLGKMPSVGRMLGSFNWSDPFSAPKEADPRRSRRVSVTSASGGATVLAVMTSYGTFEDWVVPNHGALSVALACGELEIVSELLMWGWRNKKVMAVLTREQVEKTVLNVWTAKECIVKEKDREIVGTSQMIAEEEAETRLFTLLTLSCKVTADGAETLAEASDQPDSDRSSFVTPKLPLDENAQNPVEIAVSLSVLCCKEANVFTRDMRTMRRLLRAASSFEHVACGLVHGASIAAAQADEDRQYNPWKMGKEKISPSEVLEEFVRRPLENAAQHNCKIFISQPLVYAHIQDMYWPMRSHASPDDELSAWQVFSLQAILLTANLLAVPLLPFLPRSWEHSMEEELRTQLSKSPIPYGLVWLLPAGRLALWFISCFGIACILTTMPPVLDGDTGWPWSWDLMLLLFVLGIIEGEADEVWRGGLYAYTRDPFNVLDVSAVITMLIMLVCRFLMLTFNPEDAVVAGESVIEEVGITFQAFAAMSVWLRMLQMLNLSPTSGPMLLMAMRMMQDLKEFLKLAMLVVIAFGSAFFVLVHAATRRLEAQREHSSSYEEEEEGSRREAANKLFAALVQGVLNSEPADVIAALPNSTVAWGLMLFFGVVVVLLLLNLLIARFAKTFDLVSESVDEVFKLAFARIVLAGREMELAPRPLNLVRRLVDLVASCACFCNIDTVKYVDLAHLSSPESPTHARDAAHHVREFSAFIERAISPDVKLYPEQVEEYVRKHRQDMNTEERWRYMLNAKVNELQLSMYYWQNSQHADKRKAKIDGEAKQREIATLQSLVRNMPAEVAKRCGGSGKQSFVPMEPVSPTRNSDAAGSQLSARLKALESSTASKLGSLSASIEQMEGRIEAKLVELLAAMQPQTVVATNVRLEGEPARLRRTDSDNSLKI
ncbi:hypothetical protein AB1Y20_002069 [Prymnesium parvum]|uniref:Ion transport domain-containing protein n=1 Tax=Prymnesium parvum TaxID=97485 RepID=A0AB34J7V8_PRYPA